MRKITGEEFKQLIKKDPSWCLTLINPLEITTFVDLSASKITHLSSLLHFKPETCTDDGSADFSFCKDLKKASGNFYDFVSFDGSSVEHADINAKVICSHDTDKFCADFDNCSNLISLKGKFLGTITFKSSSINYLRASITPVCIHHAKAVIFGCDNLIPHTKYLNGYSIDGEFRKRCMDIELRKKLSRFPEI